MDKNSNTYTFIYATVMVIVVAAALSYAAISLRDAQQRNMNIEKKQNILSAIHITVNSREAEKVFTEKIVDSFVINNRGEQIEGNAFTVLQSISREWHRPVESRSLPVFVGNIDGQTKYIFPLFGRGLWGALWGFIALEDDMNTIFGVTFNHEGETPGLGAEISGKPFQQQFEGRTIFDESGNLVSVTVARANEKAPREHRVDGISGGTITSRGVQNMLIDDLNAYLAFLQQRKSEKNEQ